MRKKNIIGAYSAGVLSANSLPHLATAVAGQRMMTPLRGRRSGRWPNLVWGGMNLAGGLALVARSHRAEQPWARHLIAYAVGGATFSAWAVFAEAVLKFNDER